MFLYLNVKLMFCVYFGEFVQLMYLYVFNLDCTEIC